MARCILLNFDGTRIALRENNFVKESLNYNFSGEVTKFQLSKGDRKSYLYTIHENDQSKFYGFLELGNYTSLRAQRDADKNVKFTKEQWRTGELTLSRIADFQLEKAQAGDTIIGCFEEVSGNKICKRYYQIAYNGTIPDKHTFKQQGTKIEGELGLIDCTTFDPEKQSGKFFSAYKNHTFFDDPNSPAYTDPELILEISNLIDSIDQTIFEAWNVFLTNPYSTENFFKLYDPNEPLPPSFYNRSNFISYRDGLRRWLRLLKERQEDLKHLKNLPHGDLLLLLFIMDRENMLGPLPVQLKIDALAAIVADYWVTEFFFSFNFGQMQLFDRENLVMAIVNSVSAAQATEFIQKLEATIITVDVDDPDLQLTYSYSKNLYIRLFSAIDDYGGENNFTKLIWKINQLFGIKAQVQTIIDNHPAGFTAGNLEALKNNGTIVHSFIWKEKGVLGRTSFKAKINDIGDKLTITESICSSTKSKKNSIKSSDGPAAVWYTEVCDGYINNTFNNISHFDLVYVHFYDHPSFIDLRGNPNYEGKGFFTFAGFFYYLQIKERTYWTETTFSICLFVLSVLSPLGQVMAALRGANYVYAVLNIASLTGNTAILLTSNTNFTNYLAQKYPNDHNDIITVLNILGIFSVLNANQPNLDLVKVLPNSITKVEAAKYFGATKELLKDIDLLSALTIAERAQLERLSLKLESELFKFRGIPEITDVIKKQAATLKYYGSVRFRTALNMLSVAEREAILLTFAELDGIHRVWMARYGDAFVERWKLFSNVEKEAAKVHAHEVIETLVVELRHETSYAIPLYTDVALLDEIYINSMYGHIEIAPNVKLTTKIEELVSSVVADVANLRSNRSIGNLVDGKNAPVSASRMYDKSTNQLSKICYNFTKNECKPGKAYESFLNNHGVEANLTEEFIHPNIYKRYQDLLNNEPRWKALLDPIDRVKNEPKFLRHAEVRALNDLAGKKFGNNLVSDVVFDTWIREEVYGFNHYLGKSNMKIDLHPLVDIIHDPCANCYYLTDLVNYVQKPGGVKPKYLD